MKKATRFMTETIRYGVNPVLKVSYKFKFDKKSSKGIKSPCLILANHATTMDPFLMGEGFKFPINYVASDAISRLKVVGPFFNWFVRPIPKAKNMADISTVMNIMKVLKAGGSVGLFPEGNRTLNGETADIPDSIGKLCKKLQVPIVFVKFRYGYMTKPRWGKKIRKGRMTGSVERVLTPEEKENMTADEVYRVVKETLHYDVHADERENNIPFKDKRRAENIEQLLFMCPDCHAIGTVKSKNQHFWCGKCGLKMEYDLYGRFIKIQGKTELKNPLEWDRWQISFVKDWDISGFSPDFEITSDNNVRLYDVTLPNKRVCLAKDGRLSVMRERLTFNAKKSGEQVFKIRDITAAAVEGKKKIRIYTADNKSYFLKLEETSSPYKYVVMIYKIKATQQGEEMTYYGI